MPKKPATPKTKSVVPIKAAAKARMQKKAKAPAPKAKAAKPAAPKTTGMWKILEMKQAQLHKQSEQKQDGHHHHPHSQAVQPARNTRFTKFAGHRRKVG